LLDISARARGSIDYRTLEQIVESAFVPMVYGGLIRNVEDAERILRTGFEKVSLNTNARSGIRPISERFGKQAVIASVDYHETERKDLPEILQTLEEEGAGEILLTDIDREGTYTGYDLETLSELRGLLSIPVIINGGASRVSDFKEALAHGADACAAGSMFVYHGGLKSVLINYPDRELLDDIANMQ
jgi:cyclase